MASKITAKNAPAPKLMADPSSAELQRLMETVCNSHGKWIGSNPKATLGDLLSFLRRVEEEFLTFDEDDALADIGDELGDAADYLSEFEDYHTPVCSGGELPTVGYRAANVEEDIDQMEELIGLVGESFKVKRLQLLKKPAKK